MYNAYGSNILKKYQVNMGMPYPVRQQKPSPVVSNLKNEAVDRDKEKEDILKNAKLEAEKVLHEANAKADAMLNSAKDKITAHMMEVEQQAKEEGYKNGETLARKHYTDLIEEAEDIKQKTKEVYDNTISGLENKMVEIIIEVARKVIGTEITQNRDVILGLIRNAVLSSSPTDKVVVRVCPDDYEYAVENKDKLDFKNINEIEIIKDNALKKGECLVDTGFGMIDSSIETQLQSVEHKFSELPISSPKEETAIVTD